MRAVPLRRASGRGRGASSIKCNSSSGGSDNEQETKRDGAAAGGEGTAGGPAESAFSVGLLATLLAAGSIAPTDAPPPPASSPPMRRRTRSAAGPTPRTTPAKAPRPDRGDDAEEEVEEAEEAEEEIDPFGTADDSGEPSDAETLGSDDTSGASFDTPPPDPDFDPNHPSSQEATSTELMDDEDHRGVAQQEEGSSESEGEWLSGSSS